MKQSQYTYPLSNVDQTRGCKERRVVKDEGYSSLYFMEVNRLQLLEARNRGLQGEGGEMVTSNRHRNGQGNQQPV